MFRLGVSAPPPDSKHEGPGRMWVVWLIVAVAAVAFSGCGSTGATTSSSHSSPPSSEASSPPPSSPPPAPPPAAKRKTKTKKVPPSSGPAYTGLGATTAAFSGDHNTTEPSRPVPGVATYHVDFTRSGRVTAFSVHITATPPMGNGERLGLVEGISLPDDLTTVKQTGTCSDFKSARLAQLVGNPYAEATTTTGSDTAQITVVPRPTC